MKNKYSHLKGALVKNIPLSQILCRHAILSGPKSAALKNILVPTPPEIFSLSLSGAEPGRSGKISLPASGFLLLETESLI